MARKKEPEWISGSEAAQIMTGNTNHAVSDAYVRVLAKKGKIRSRAINGREKEYHRGDVAGYVVERRSETRKARTA